MQHEQCSPKQLPISSEIKKPWRVLIGQYHQPDRIYAALSQEIEIELVRLNSAWKFAWLAEGKADIYPRLGPTSEWDTAAGQCILESIGGSVVDFDGHSLQYNARDTLRNPEFFAVRNPSVLNQVLTAFRKVRRAL